MCGIRGGVLQLLFLLLRESVSLRGVGGWTGERERESRAGSTSSAESVVSA